MSGETKQNVSSWTIDSLKEYLESRLSEADKRNEQRFTAQETAIAKSEAAAERRFAGVNEFRAQLADQASTFMPRSESEARHSASAEKVNALTTRLDRMEGRSGGFSASWAILIGAVGLAATLVTIFFALRR